MLSSLLLQLRLFRDAAAKPGADPAALAQQAAGLSDLAREVLDGVRRMALDLRPRMLEDLGLAAALRAYAEEWSARTGVALSLHAALPPGPPGRALPASAEIALYRLVQEALANVAHHAAASHVDVTLEEQDDTIVVEVRDDGRGFALDRISGAATGQAVRNGAATPPSAPTPRADQTAGATGAAGPDLFTSGLGAGLGLFSMQERIALAGGTFRIESTPGQGTTVRATLPRARATAGALTADGATAMADYPAAVSGVR